MKKDIILTQRQYDVLHWLYRIAREGTAGFFLDLFTDSEAAEASTLIEMGFVQASDGLASITANGMSAINEGRIALAEVSDLAIDGPAAGDDLRGVVQADGDVNTVTVDIGMTKLGEPVSLDDTEVASVSLSFAVERMKLIGISRTQAVTIFCAFWDNEEVR